MVHPYLTICYLHKNYIPSRVRRWRLQGFELIYIYIYIYQSLHCINRAFGLNILSLSYLAIYNTVYYINQTDRSKRKSGIHLSPYTTKNSCLRVCATAQIHDAVRKKNVLGTHIFNRNSIE